MKSSIAFTIAEPLKSITKNGRNLIAAKGARGADLWIEWTSSNLDHKVYNKDFKAIADVDGSSLYEAGK